MAMRDYRRPLKISIQGWFAKSFGNHLCLQSLFFSSRTKVIRRRTRNKSNPCSNKWQGKIIRLPPPSMGTSAGFSTRRWRSERIAQWILKILHHSSFPRPWARMNQHIRILVDPARVTPRHAWLFRRVAKKRQEPIFTPAKETMSLLVGSHSKVLLWFSAVTS